jgi:biotin transporter BioY
MITFLHGTSFGVLTVFFFVRLGITLLPVLQSTSLFLFHQLPCLDSI